MNTALDFIDWLMSNCELHQGANNWCYKGEYHSNEELFGIFISKKGDGKWLELEKNPDKFNEAAANNCLVKFDDGTICNYNDEQPLAILTHFIY